jgi:hypothetical protein
MMHARDYGDLADALQNLLQLVCPYGFPIVTHPKIHAELKAVFLNLLF